MTEEQLVAILNRAMREAENLAVSVGGSEHEGVPHLVIAYGRLRTVIREAIEAAAKEEKLK